MARNPPHKWAEQKEEKERERRGKGNESGWDQHSWKGAVKGKESERDYICTCIVMQQKLSQLRKLTIPQ